MRDDSSSGLTRRNVLESRRLAHQTSDDAFREIQLNGKQLVFLFMVATVVSVVIFLCGVFVGCGVRAERAMQVADAGVAGPVTTPDVVPSQEPTPTSAGSDPTSAAPPPAVDELSYFNRLEKKAPAAEDLQPASAKAAAPATAPPVERKKEPPASKPVETPASTPSAVPAPPAKDVARATTGAEPAADRLEPTSQGFAIQVGALRQRQEADSIAKRLSAKGYTAYVVTPANGGPSVYRVRVGKFKTRREAETIASRLQKEEQFSPWITR